MKPSLVVFSVAALAIVFATSPAYAMWPFDGKKADGSTATPSAPTDASSALKLPGAKPDVVPPVVHAPEAKAEVKSDAALAEPKKPEIKTPEVKAPEAVKLPEAPKAPEIKAPEVKAVEAPAEVKMHDVKAPAAAAAVVAPVVDEKAKAAADKAKAEDDKAKAEAAAKSKSEAEKAQLEAQKKAKEIEEKAKAEDDRKAEEKAKKEAATIQGHLASKGKFKTLLELLKLANITTLKSPGNFTIFAPTDDAFARFNGISMEKLKDPEQVDTLKSLLGYHMLNGNFLLKNIAGRVGAPNALQGDELKIDATSEPVHVGKAKIIDTDGTASNGTIYVLDEVVMPPSLMPAKKEEKAEEKK